MKELLGYQKSIAEATGCTSEQVSEVEDIMRNDIVHSTLDWLSPKQFNKAAKEAYDLYIYLHSPKGIQYMREFEQY